LQAFDGCFARQAQDGTFARDKMALVALATNSAGSKTSIVLIKNIGFKLRAVFYQAANANF